MTDERTLSRLSKCTSESEWMDVAEKALISRARSTKGSRAGKLHTAKSRKAAAAVAAEAKDRSARLATTADTVGVSFAGREFQATYYASKFKRRGMLMHAVLNDVVETVAAETANRSPSSRPTEEEARRILQAMWTAHAPEKLPSIDAVLEKYRGRHNKLLLAVARKYGAQAELKAHIEARFRATGPRTCCLGIPLSGPGNIVRRVGSFGGGPGTDTAGLVWFQREHPELCFECVLFDYEKSWRRYETTLRSLFGAGVDVAFAPCDVSAPIEAENVNRRVFGGQRVRRSGPKISVRDLDVLAFMYVCHETWTRAEASDLVFYRQLATMAKTGCLVVICDVMGKSRATLERIAAAMTDARGGAAHRVNVPNRHRASVLVLRLGEARGAASAPCQGPAAAAGLK
jgi:hypothetical protein